MNQRAVAGTLPFIVHNGRRWFRRDLIEQAAAARFVPDATVEGLAPYSRMNA